jgi:hypothetical protein
MKGLDALKAAVPGFVRRKGRGRDRISALEASYREYRLKRHVGKPPSLVVFHRATATAGRAFLLMPRQTDRTGKASWFPGHTV